MKTSILELISGKKVLAISKSGENMSIDIDKIRKSVGFIGESEQIHDMLTTIGQVASTDIIVLINSKSFQFSS